MESDILAKSNQLRLEYKKQKGIGKRQSLDSRGYILWLENKVLNRSMKAELEQLYGELMQLKEDSKDYLLKNKYQAKMKAIEILLEKMPYSAPNPAREE